MDACCISVCVCHKLYYLVVEMVIVVRLKLPCGRVVIELIASMMI